MLEALDVAIAMRGVLRTAVQQEQLEAELVSAATSRLNGLLHGFGILGEAQVRLAEKSDNQPIFALSINGNHCRHDEQLFVRIYASLLQKHLSEQMNDEVVMTWASSLVRSDIHGKQDFIQFICLACEEILKIRPSLLLHSPQIISYRQLLARHWAEVPEAEWLRLIFAQLLDLGLSFADTATVASTLKDAVQVSDDPDEVIEALISSLQPQEIEVRLAPGYLRVITESDKATKERIFAGMRDWFFYELGLVLPDFRLVTDEQLSPGNFAFRVNHVLTLPRVGLAAGEVFLDAEPDRLQALGIDGVVNITHPVYRREASVIRQQDSAVAEGAGITPRTPLGFLVLCLSAEIRSNAAALLSERAVRNALNRVNSIFPALIEGASARCSIPRLTRVLRELISEEVSIRDLRQILQTILECDYVIADESALIIFDERIAFASAPSPGWQKSPAVLVTSVRRALKRYLSQKYARGESAIRTYLLDPHVEQKLTAHSRATEPLTEKDVEGIIEAVQSEVKGWQGAALPPVLTNTEVRRPFRQIIAPVFPSLPVVAYQELSPEANIQPVSRISLGA
jgi:flagellar biosynthesis component FlhA